MEIITPLGEGGFGLVKLVKVKGIDDRAYALKCIQKTRVVQYGQQRHIMDEKNILSKIQSTFILALHKTFKGKYLPVGLVPGPLEHNLEFFLR